MFRFVGKGSALHAINKCFSIQILKDKRRSDGVGNSTWLHRLWKNRVVQSKHNINVMTGLECTAINTLTLNETRITLFHKASYWFSQIHHRVQTNYTPGTNLSIYCCVTKNVYSPIKSWYKELFSFFQLILWNKNILIFSDWQLQFRIYILQLMEWKLQYMN